MGTTIMFFLFLFLLILFNPIEGRNGLKRPFGLMDFGMKQAEEEYGLLSQPWKEVIKEYSKLARPLKKSNPNQVDMENEENWHVLSARKTAFESNKFGSSMKAGLDLWKNYNNNDDDNNDKMDNLKKRKEDKIFNRRQENGNMEEVVCNNYGFQRNGTVETV